MFVFYSFELLATLCDNYVSIFGLTKTRLYCFLIAACMAHGKLDKS
jgi:hypothetical protein